MDLGTAAATPGSIERGWYELTRLPTGGTEDIPVTIACGEADGPTLWVTAGLHGNEVTGIGAAQDVITPELLDDLAGTVVCLPILNPSGLRLDQRNSYYHDADPNRTFPYGVGRRATPPSLQERLSARLFEAFAASADALVSLHEGWITELPYTIVERVRYGRERTRAEAEALAARTLALAEAFGLPVIREYDVAVQEEAGLQRSFECAAVNAAGVPAITPELGSPHVIEEAYLGEAITGVHNVMRAMGMLPGDPVPLAVAPRAPVDYPVKRVDGPLTPTAGIVRHWVDVNEPVGAGDPIADITTPHGVVKATVETEEDGYILGRRHGLAVYETDHLVSMAARDDGELVVERPA